MNEQSLKFEGWCILELMGHRRLGGFVREQEIAGHGFLRIDVPSPDLCARCGFSRLRCTAPGTAGCCDACTHREDVAATQFYSPSSVYGLTPVTEKMARAVAANNIPKPVQRWELPAAPEPPVAAADPAACLNCGHATPHTENHVANYGDDFSICGWQRDPADSQPAFRCDCTVLDLGDPPQEPIAAPPHITYDEDDLPL